MRKLFWMTLVIGPLVRMILKKQPPKWPKRKPRSTRAATA